MDPRCPGLYLFEVNADIGISSSEIYEPKNITDEVVIPPPELMPSKKARTATDMNGTLPHSHKEF